MTTLGRDDVVDGRSTLEVWERMASWGRRHAGLAFDAIWPDRCSVQRLPHETWTPLRGDALACVYRAVTLVLREAEASKDEVKERVGSSAFACFIQVRYALEYLTREHGSQCQCPGCRVLRPL